MEQNFVGFRVVAIILKILAAIVLVVGVLGGIIALINFGGFQPIWVNNALQLLNLVQNLTVLVLIVWGLYNALVFFGFGMACEVLLAMEQNTRVSREQATRTADLIAASIEEGRSNSS